jgi:hypothetical protein
VAQALAESVKRRIYKGFAPYQGHFYAISAPLDRDFQVVFKHVRAIFGAREGNH